MIAISSAAMMHILEILFVRIEMDREMSMVCRSKMNEINSVTEMERCHCDELADIVCALCRMNE